MKLIDFLKSESGRQHAQRTAHRRKSIWERARITLAPLPKHNKSQEIARRKRQIERGILKVGGEQ